MSDYLEKAAAVLAQAEANIPNLVSFGSRSEQLLEIAAQYAALAAIDRGLLPEPLAGVPCPCWKVDRHDSHVWTAVGGRGPFTCPGLLEA